MKRIVSTGPKTSRIIEVPDVTPNADEIKIKLKYVGVCMSEHYDWLVAEDGKAFGHEPMGVVAEVGANVTGFKVGDRVSGLWGSSLPGGGGMTEYSIANPEKDIVVKIPDNLKDEDAVFEPLACLLSAVSKVRPFVQGDRVCVVGCGYMGCGAISLLKLKGAYVVAIDIRRESLAEAKRFGADEIFTPSELPAELLEFSNGFDRVMEWGETAESLDLAVNLTNMCGQLCIGAYHTGGKRLVDVQQLNLKAIECLSVHPREAELNRKGAFNAARLLSSGEWEFVGVPVKIYPMSMFDNAHEELESKYGKYMKALIDMENEHGEPYILNA